MPRRCRMRQSTTGPYLEHLIAGRWESLPADERTQAQRDRDQLVNLKAMYPRMFKQHEHKGE